MDLRKVAVRSPALTGGRRSRATSGGRAAMRRDRLEKRLRLSLAQGRAR
jgi:hypothetical protein